MCESILGIYGVCELGELYIEINSAIAKLLSSVYQNFVKRCFIVSDMSNSEITTILSLAAIVKKIGFLIAILIKETILHFYYVNFFHNNFHNTSL